MLLSALPALAYLGLIVYSVIDCVQTPPDELHLFSRAQWITVILIVPVLGAALWLLVGRPRHGRHERDQAAPDRDAGYGWTAEGASQYPIGPDDDVEFMESLGRAQREQNRLLTRQEEDRRRREEQQRPDPPDSSD